MSIKKKTTSKKIQGAKKNSCDCHVVAVIKECLEIMKMLERVVLSEEMVRKKAAKKLMTKEEKISYVTKWEKKNRLMLLLKEVFGHLGEETKGLLIPSNFSVDFFCSIKCTESSPHLQTVFQADACHMNFGIHIVLMLWYYCKWQYISSCIWNSFWE